MKAGLIVLSLACGLILSQQVFAGENGEAGSCGMAKSGIMQIAKADETQPQAQAAAPVEVGNTICPVSGEKITPGKEFKAEYNGKIYNLCCSMCKKDFMKDPQAAIKKIKETEAAK